MFMLMLIQWKRTPWLNTCKCAGKEELFNYLTEQVRDFTILKKQTIKKIQL